MKDVEGFEGFKGFEEFQGFEGFEAFEGFGEFHGFEGFEGFERFEGTPKLMRIIGTQTNTNTRSLAVDLRELAATKGFVF